MERQDIIKAFTQLGIICDLVGQDKDYPGVSCGITEAEYLKLKSSINKQFLLNGWFTKDQVQNSIRAIGSWLTEENLNTWLSNYNYASQPKRVGIIMAGNIPLVGFHDLLCVVASGNIAVCKMSSNDNTLLPELLSILLLFNPELKSRIELSIGKLGVIEAVIATGSDNSTLHFEQYFGKYPHIFRKNRTSIAVLDGSETEQDFFELGKDIFSYFGLGCRNVTHLLVPYNYDFSLFFKGIFPYGDIINHFKYGNNYDYNKTIHLMNQIQLLDNNFVLLRESEQLHSPLAMIHYHTYKNEQEIEIYLEEHKDAIQVIVGKKHTPFGQAQNPTLSDYADGVDTMLWLNSL